MRLVDAGNNQSKTTEKGGSDSCTGIINQSSRLLNQSPRKGPPFCCLFLFSLLDCGRHPQTFPLPRIHCPSRWLAISWCFRFWNWIRCGNRYLYCLRAFIACDERNLGIYGIRSTKLPSTGLVGNWNLFAGFQIYPQFLCYLGWLDITDLFNHGLIWYWIGPLHLAIFFPPGH